MNPGLLHHDTDILFNLLLTGPPPERTVFFCLYPYCDPLKLWYIFVLLFILDYLVVIASWTFPWCETPGLAQPTALIQDSFCVHSSYPESTPHPSPGSCCQPSGCVLSTSSSMPCNPVMTISIMFFLTQITKLLAQGHDLGVMENSNIYWQIHSAEK